VDIFKVPVGVIQSYFILKRFKPDVLFSKGGFVSLPPSIAAYLLKIPVVSHESDLEPGLANKMVFRFSRKICVSYPETKEFLKQYSGRIIVTGNPVREEIFKGSKEEGYKFTGLKKTKKIVLIIGGSQGSSNMNGLIKRNLSELLKKYQIVHLVGKGKLDFSVYKDGYKQYEFLNEQFKDVYAISDLIICRAGANTLGEIAALSKNAILMPLGLEQSRGDQIQNARLFSKKYGWPVLDDAVSNEDFMRVVNLTINLSETHRKENFINPTKLISDVIMSVIK